MISIDKKEEYVRRRGREGGMGGEGSNSACGRGSMVLCRCPCREHERQGIVIGDRDGE